MEGGKDLRELLVADLALLRGLAAPGDVVAAMQRYWEHRGEDGVTLASELVRIARLPPGRLRLVEHEAEELLARVEGDAGLALSRHGGLDGSVYAALGTLDPGLRRHLRVRGVRVRASLRPVPPDRYVDFEVVGRGGMGVVYAALDTEMNRRVAFKMVRAGPGRPATDPPASPLSAARPEPDSPESAEFEEMKARLVQEAWVTGGLEHPGIVPVYEIGQTPSGVPYYAMRYVRGERTLADAIREVRDAPLDERLALLEPFLKVCDALRYAHDRGVIHRDIKPANVALGAYGEVVLLDWGLARLEGRDDLAQSTWRVRVEDLRSEAGVRTLEGGVVGTAGYMAPEAALGRLSEVDARSDVYSLGVILFEILTGRLPFQFRSFAEYAALVLREVPPESAHLAPGVPAALSELCRRALAREPRARPASPQELAEGIRAWQVQSRLDREAEGLLRDATAALEAAGAAVGAARVAQVERAAVALAQAEASRSPTEQTRALRARADALRHEGIRQQERARVRRVLRRGSAAALAAIVAAGALVTTAIEHKRREAEAARRDATTSAEGLRAALADRSRALEEARHVALVLASGREAEVDPMRGLLLAREAFASRPDAMSRTALHVALASSHERLRLRDPEGRSEIACGAVLPDGSGFLGATKDGRLLRWDAAGRLQASISLGGFEAHRMEVAADASAVLLGRRDSVYEVWSLDGKRRARLGHPRSEGSSSSLFVTFLGSGSRLGVARGTTASVRDLDGNVLFRVEDLSAPVTSVSGCRDEVLLALGQQDGSVTLLDGVRGNRETHPTGAAPKAVYGVRLTDDGRGLVLWSLQGVLERYDLPWSPRFRHREEVWGPHRLAMTGDASIVAASLGGSERRGFVRLFGPDGSALGTAWGGPAAVWADAVVGGGATLVGSCINDETVWAWDVSGALSRVVRLGCGGWSLQGVVGATDALLLRTWPDGVLRVVSLDASEAGEASLGRYSIYRQSRAWSGRGQTIYVGDGSQGSNLSAAGALVRLPSLRLERLEDPEVEWRRYLPRARVLAERTKGGASILRFEDGRAVRREALPGAGVQEILEDEEDGGFLTWTQDGLVQTLDPEGNSVGAPAKHPGRPVHGVWSPFHRAWLTISEDGRVVAWGRDGRSQEVLEGSARRIGPFAVSPRDGRLAIVRGSPLGGELAVIKGGTTIGRVALQTGDSSYTWFGDLTLQFSPDGERILYSAQSEAALLLDASGSLVAELRPKSGPVVSASLDPTGTRVLVTTILGETLVHDRDGKPLFELPRQENDITWADWSPDGTQIMTVTAAGRLRLWEATDERLEDLAAARTTRDMTPEERQRLAPLLPR